ncbi:type 1 glutamine amidotransferase domain-containing protein [Ruminiclostridium cellobioparum]|uniref:type 1 glutamine amidotransferase domain-containing protein n=1 Tax=Ruminiclostridium cellobioparum TaxID=29355 RepID=UPI0004824344|nr:type 1 glutamine amidotransferase domain-containing protein [Ruminiclostridium cellobioparum]
MKKILMITADGYDDSEVLYPYFRLLEEGIRVDTASFEKGSVSGKYHFVINADMSFEEINPEEYSGLMIPGGKAPEKIRQNSAALKAVCYFMEKQLPVAAICHGQQILISARVLSGRKCTCYPGIRDDLINAGGVYVEQRVVVDGKLVTSRRPEDLPYFMREFVSMLDGRGVSQN